VIFQRLEEMKIIVCVGPGGVGKTTTAAALAALAARTVPRTLVSTIDPAPRLADALGVALSAEPLPVPDAVSRTLAIPPGRLYVARLDTARAFAQLVEEQVSVAAMRRRIFGNPIYRQITTTLTGSQEYAATLALYDVMRGGQFDLVVLDTPPTAHALDFLDAPHRIAEAISSPAIQWFARPVAPTRFSLQRLRAGGALMLKRLGKFVGSRFLEDVGAFLTDFQVVLAGFLERAQSIEARLRQPDVGFVLVLAPETAAVDEALGFEQKLREAGIVLAAFVVNRVHPPGLAPAGAAQLGAELERRLGGRADLAGVAAEDLRLAARQLSALAGEEQQLSDDEEREMARLAARHPSIPIVRIPLLDRDVTNLETLRSISAHLSRNDAPVSDFAVKDEHSFRR
jgi:anion-transporting  ArsA/GET3 family ATPase